jgi:hypothetical protein
MKSRFSSFAFLRRKNDRGGVDVRRPSERECDAELRALEQQDASALDRVHEPFEFVASHAAALHQSRSQRVDFALVLSQYLSRVCATVGDPSLNFLYLANLVGGKQVQCVRAITAAGPIWQEMAEDYFGLMARVENCYPVDQPKVLGDLSLRMLSRTIIANLNFEHPATKRPSDDGMPGFMVRVGFEVIHPSLLSVMCLSPRRRVVVSRCAVLVLSECERPKPPLAYFGGGRGLNLRAASIPTCQDL